MPVLYPVSLQVTRGEVFIFTQLLCQILAPKLGADTALNRLLAAEEIQETARGLHKAVVITKRRMKEYDALCNLEIVVRAEQANKYIRPPKQNEHIVANCYITSYVKSG